MPTARCAQDEPIHGSSPMLPVHWCGDGQEFCRLSGNVTCAKGGACLTGHLRRVAMFRDDGHPDLVANVLDLTGDQRDEIVLWNEKRVSGPHPRPPVQGNSDLLARLDNNESKYRMNVSLPTWQEVKVRR